MQARDHVGETWSVGGLPAAGCWRAVGATAMNEQARRSADPHLRRCDDVALRFDGARAQQHLPVGAACVVGMKQGAPASSDNMPGSTRPGGNALAARLARAAASFSPASPAQPPQHAHPWPP